MEKDVRYLKGCFKASSKSRNIKLLVDLLYYSPPLFTCKPLILLLSSEIIPSFFLSARLRSILNFHRDTCIRPLEHKLLYVCTNLNIFPSVRLQNMSREDKPKDECRFKLQSISKTK